MENVDPEAQWASVEIRASLVGRRAGGGAAKKARELRRETPLSALLSRVRRVHPDERAWGKGATGEKVAGFWLSRLPKGWYTLHDVPVGERGANIDHVVIGPGGVFTVNTKNLTGTVEVSERACRHNGYRTDYLPKSSHEARRAAKLLSAAVGRDVQIRPVLAVVVDDLIVNAMPPDVTVLRVGGLTRWLKSEPIVLNARDVIEIGGAATKPATWIPSKDEARAGDTCVCGGVLVARVRRSDGHTFLGCSSYPNCRRTFAGT
jgi:hypothetical protein